ncbi:MAG: hypothetical protein ABL911_04475 [Gallionella sp.]|nr:hypothetical protein [Gallionella sp.]
MEPSADRYGKAWQSLQHGLTLVSSQSIAKPTASCVIDSAAVATCLHTSIISCDILVYQARDNFDTKLFHEHEAPL